ANVWWRASPRRLPTEVKKYSNDCRTVQTARVSILFASHTPAQKGAQSQGPRLATCAKSDINNAYPYACLLPFRTKELTMKAIVIATLATIALCFLGPPQISAAPGDGGAIGKAATEASVVTAIRSRSSGSGSSSSGRMGSSGSMGSSGYKTGTSHKHKTSSCGTLRPGCICKKGVETC